LGIDSSEHRYLKDLGLQMSRAVDLYPSLRELVEINHAARSFIEFFRDHISIKLKSPDEALLSKLLERNKNENLGLGESQLISVAIFLFIAGQETSSALIGNVIYSLLRNPDSLARLKSDLSLVDETIEETLRYDSPVQLLGRMATENITIRGKKIEKGSAVTLVIGSANRDEDIFSTPDKFDITRKPNRHLSFGSGIHFCLGDWLGRRQAQLALKGFIGRFNNPEMLTKQIEWNKNLAIRSIQSLLLKVAD
jgi:cytochrome P450